MNPPLAFRWDGDAMRPLPAFATKADAQFVAGEVYRLVPHEQRSAATHAHYFALVGEAWSNLPERLVERFPTPDHLRRYALVRAGYCEAREIVASSRREALRLAAFVRPMDPYAVVTVKEAVVTVYTARSQSMRAMGKHDFAASKQAVLDVLAGLLEVAPAALADAGAA